MKKIISDGVFEGGGVKTIAFTGALKVLEDNGFIWQNVAGTSGGSIIAALLAANFSASEILDFVQTTDFYSFVSKDYTNFTHIREFVSLIRHKGVFKGDAISAWVNDLLNKKLGNPSSSYEVKFKDLIIPGENSFLMNNPKYKRKYKLHVIAIDISDGRMLILPEDIADFGINPDDLSVSLAVRMSISIPYFFRPVILQKNDGTKSYVVDGGVLSDYPVWLFDVPGSPPYPTVGLNLDGGNATNNKITNIFNFSSAIIQTMLEAQDDSSTISEVDSLRTMFIDTGDISSTNFNLTKEQIQFLIDSGTKSAEDFVKNWDSNYMKHVELRGLRN